MEVLEGVRVGAEFPGLEEGFQAELDAGLLLHALEARARLGVGGDLVLVGVGLDELVDLGLGDRVHGLDQVAHAVAVDGPAQLDLGLDLVALGDRDLAHVVAEAGDLEAAAVGEGGGRAHPAGELLEDGRGLPVADHDLARQAQARADEAVLPVAVGRLVEVHEVHVDGVPGDVAVELGVEVAERLVAAR